MYTIEFKMGTKKAQSTTRSTIAEAQQHAREIMGGWDIVEVFYTKCPALKFFQSCCGAILKETK